MSHLSPHQQLPQKQPNQDLLEFALTFNRFLDYINASKHKADLQDQDTNNPFGEVYGQSLVQGDQLLRDIQSAINKALMDKDLDRMKLLGAAKNALFEKLQILRTEVGKKFPSAISALPTNQRISSQESQLSADDLKPEDSLLSKQARHSNQVSTIRSLDEAPIKKQKSKLTQAAEAKILSEKSAPPSSRIRHVHPIRHAGRRTARRATMGFGPLQWSLVIIVTLIISGFIVWAIRARSPHTATDVSKRNTNNHPPQMINATLKQLPLGIILRPQCHDPDKDPITFSIQWFKNGKKIGGVQSARLPPEQYKPGDEIDAVIIPTDGYHQGNPLRTPSIRITKMGEKKPKN